MLFTSTAWKSGSILKVTLDSVSSRNKSIFSDGISTLDSKTDYTDDDFVVSNNCADFNSHKTFTEEMIEIDKLLIKQRNQIDEGIREEAKKSGLLEAIFGTSLNLLLPMKK